VKSWTTLSNNDGQCRTIWTSVLNGTAGSDQLTTQYFSFNKKTTANIVNDEHKELIFRVFRFTRWFQTSGAPITEYPEA
jgi:hypothetical protein